MLIGCRRADKAKVYEHADGCDYGFFGYQYPDIRHVPVDG